MEAITKFTDLLDIKMSFVNAFGFVLNNSKHENYV